MRKKRTPITDKIKDLSKYGFKVDYLAGIYAHKGMAGLNQIEGEMKYWTEKIGICM